MSRVHSHNNKNYIVFVLKGHVLDSVSFLSWHHATVVIRTLNMSHIGDQKISGVRLLPTSYYELLPTSPDTRFATRSMVLRSLFIIHGSEGDFPAYPLQLPTPGDCFNALRHIIKFTTRCPLCLPQGCCSPAFGASTCQLTRWVIPCT